MHEKKSVLLDLLPPRKIIGEYEGGIRIDFGHLITPLQANDTPTSFRWRENFPDRLYVLMMLGRLCLFIYNLLPIKDN